MSRLTILLLMCLFSFPALAEDRALIIGVDRYPHMKSKQQLTGSVNDARAMAALAKDVWGFRPGQIKLLLNEQASAANILAAIKDWLINGTSPGDRVLLTYSGHGYYKTDDNDDELDGYDETLAPYDVKQAGLEMVNMVSDDQISDLLASIKDRDVMLVVDSCHSGTITRALDLDAGTGPSIVRSLDVGQSGMTRALDDSTFDKVRRGSSFLKGGKNLMAWSAVSPSENAQEDMSQPPASRNGVFTRSFIEGLRERWADANGNGIITPMELVAYVRKKALGYCRNNACKTGMTPTLEAGREHLARDLLSWRRKRAGGAGGAGQTQGVAIQPPAPEVTDIIAADNALGVKVEILPRNHVRLGGVIKLRVTSPRPGWLIVLDVRDNGEVVQIFPNKYKKGRRLRASAPLTIPDKSYGFEFTATKAGTGKILAIVTQDNVPLDDLLAKSRDISVIPDGQDYLASLAQRLQKVWTSDKRNRAARWSLASVGYRIGK